MLYKQPGPRDGTIQCFIKRDKSKLTYHLYLCLSPGNIEVLFLLFISWLHKHPIYVFYNLCVYSMMLPNIYEYIQMVCLFWSNFFCKHCLRFLLILSLLFICFNLLNFLYSKKELYPIFSFFNSY